MKKIKPDKRWPNDIKKEFANRNKFIIDIHNEKASQTQIIKDYELETTTIKNKTEYLKKK